ncbi:hypothetical protein [Alienimonas chondri]|uniref:hypothetical protein n=1 Tax=Alienimonas chondri TaxID=2681879 RepID=UPI00148979A5|nr:hypothetical protein [Alienimonas chondri]
MPTRLTWSRIAGASRRTRIRRYGQRAVLAAALVGCSTGGLQSNLYEAKTGLQIRFAAEKAYLHRGDLFHNCCTYPLDFKCGFKSGYTEVSLYGDDCCAPPTPPPSYWGCSTSDPCERTERLNCYYDGWAHGAIAAGQDGVAGLNTVPLRDICGGQPGGMPGARGPVPHSGPAAFDPYGLETPTNAISAPTNQSDMPAFEEGPVLEEPVPAPAPIPLLPPKADGTEGGETGGEGSAGDPSPNGLLQDLLDAEAVPGADGPPEPDFSPAPSFPQFELSPDDGDAGLREGDSASLRGDAGPKVTTLWSGDG